MSRIVHISDLHFGTVVPRLVEPLLQAIGDLQPTLVVVSGDLTQRATRAQFAAAAKFLERIRFPMVVVPGNHDIPLWNIFARFLAPFGRYRHHINQDIEPSWSDEELLVLGVNTARSSTSVSGRISIEQMRRVASGLCSVSPKTLKVVVMHHPFVPPEGVRGVRVVGRARRALIAMERCGVDLILAGHLHVGFAVQTTAHYDTAERAALVVQAGTALSHRTRGQPNSFNVLDLEPDSIELRPYRWLDDQQAFAMHDRLRFEGRGRWRQVDPGAAKAAHRPRPPAIVPAEGPPKMRVHVFINRRSGFLLGPAPEWVKAVMARYPNVQAVIESSDVSSDVRAFVDRAIEARADVIVAGGGDGTVSAVADRIVGSDATLGVLPLGSLNNFARDLGIPLDIEGAVAVICTGRTARVDVAAVNGRHFVNNSSLGLYPTMLRIRSRWQPYITKWPAMLLAGIVATFRLPRMTVTVEWPEGRQTSRSPLIFVANNAYRLELPGIGRRERLDAGQLFAILPRDLGGLRLLLALWRLTAGLHLPGEVDVVKTDRLIVRSMHQRRLHVGADGELLRLDGPLEYRIHPAALQVRLPALAAPESGS